MMHSSLIEILAGNMLPRKQKVVGGAIVAVCTTLLLVTAYISLIIGGWFALEPLYGAAQACLIIAAASLALVPLLFAVNWIFNTIREKQRLKNKVEHQTSPEAQLAELAVTALPLLVRKNPVATVGIVAGLSYLMTRSQRS